MAIKRAHCASTVKGRHGDSRSSQEGEGERGKGMDIGIQFGVLTLSP